jgi:hypothetical protein
MIEGSRHRMAHPQEARMSRFRSLHFALVGALTWVALGALTPASARAAEVTAADVLDSIERGKKFLLNNQVRDRSKNDGSWNANERDNFRRGISSLVLMALLNSGMKVDDEPVARGLKYLRSCEEPNMTYEISLMIMALTAAKDGQRDNARLISLVRRLESSQLRAGENPGSWSYSAGGLDLGGDRSNAQFAILGLREAQYAGIPVNRRVWELAREHWRSQQSPDGGWSYQNSGGSTGSMTVAGISTTVILDSMLEQGPDENPDGTTACCNGNNGNQSLERALTWMERHFSVRHNPRSPSWLLYYLYGLERAGRLSGRRFFGDHDWYREGADFLVQGQTKRDGSWRGDGLMENDPVVGTSLALLFLSKGLAPVLINKLKFGDGQDWNGHPQDVRNLTEMIAGLPRWPKLLNWQQIDVKKLQPAGQPREQGVQILMQAPILYINGSESPDFSDDEVALLKEYVTQGGFIFAEATCTRVTFDQGFRRLMERMFKDEGYKLKRLTAEHPVFRSEYPLNAETVELWGVDVGCRTSIIYSPHDLACLWDKWMIVDPPARTPNMKAKITKAMQVGVNVVAYVTGREPPTKLEQPQVVTNDGKNPVARGLLEIATIRHPGGWDVAPQAVKNLLTALNRYSGAAANVESHSIPLSSPDLFKYPLIYMHGRSTFQLGKTEQERLREYINNGGVLFADACCGSAQFDKSFRELLEQTFPDQKLKRIPATHEMFSTTVGHDLRRVKRREPEAVGPDMPLSNAIVEGEPFFEGIEIDGRYVVIYSKYDISCALERQASLACKGYVPEDAVRLAVNVVLYSLLQ